MIGLILRILLLGVERIIVKRLGRNQDPAASAFHLFFLGALALLPWGYAVEVANWAFVGPMVFASGIYALAFILYVKSLAAGDASLVGPLYNFNVFFLAVGAWMALGEPLSVHKIAGLVFMLFGASYLTGEQSFGESLRALYTNIPCRHMMGASLLIATGRIIDKNLVGQVEPLVYALFLYLAIAFWLGAYLLLKGRAGGIVTVFRERTSIAVICGVVNGYSYLALLWALSEYHVSMVEPMSMLSMIITLVLSKIVLLETLGTRIWGAVFMIGGAALLV